MKKKIFLLGRHSHRTPLSYPVYKEIFGNYLTYVSDIKEANFIVLGFVIDIKDHFNEIVNSLTKHPHQKIIVLSEEPLWDTVHSGNYTKKINHFRINDIEIPFVFLNHVTTEIYNFDKIPYFITTSNDYFIRYLFMFKRNIQLTPEELFEIWSHSIYKYAFYAEKRTRKNYSIQNKKLDVYGLSLLRTELAKSVVHPGTFKVGKGWENGIIRQELPDWHLDKIARLDRKSFILSAIENTHHPQYITEKIFDAYSVLSVPLYYFSEYHRIKELINVQSIINLFGLEISDMIKKIDEFEVSETFIYEYLKSMHQLARLFSTTDTIINERYRIVESVLDEVSVLN